MNEFCTVATALKWSSLIGPFKDRAIENGDIRHSISDEPPGNLRGSVTHRAIKDESAIGVPVGRFPFGQGGVRRKVFGIGQVADFILFTSSDIDEFESRGNGALQHLLQLSRRGLVDFSIFDLHEQTNRIEPQRVSKPKTGG